MVSQTPARDAAVFANRLATRSSHRARLWRRADCCTRHHQRHCLADLVADVEDYLNLNGPWQYKLSDLYDAPAVTAAVEKIAAEERAKAAA